MPVIRPTDICYIEEHKPCNGPFKHQQLHEITYHGSGDDAPTETGFAFMHEQCPSIEQSPYAFLARTGSDFLGGSLSNSVVTSTESIPCANCSFRYDCLFRILGRAIEKRDTTRIDELDLRCEKYNAGIS